MECVNPVYVKRQGFFVRCGHCAACLDAYHKAWMVRLQAELENSSSAYFVTITFNDENYKDDLDYVKSEITLFLKRLRHFYPKVGIKYFLVAERGSKNKRLHYHALFFNLTDSMEKAQERIEEVWNKGFVHIGSVTPGSISYVTDYILKDGKTEVYRAMSKGIGLSYVNEKTVKYHQEKQDGLIRTRYGIYSVPRYYSEKLYTSEQRKQIYEKTIKDTKDDPYDRINRYNYIQSRQNFKSKQK